ncbi:sigma factor G inhibitor Gin [Bacillus solitudinis]|uniref:sigma factor G inhibitor Gin n=1 Tax=Bacillus solitudinis TaxID=2014074 RepID=UPI000C241D99|nr:sigma factor G inhibitor Gin [Bacillus solitudinis]
MTKTEVIQVQLVKTCIVCERAKSEGIELLDSFICRDCETDVINTETQDESYNFYVNQLKKIM